MVDDSALMGGCQRAAPSAGEYDARCTDATLARISFLLMTRVVPVFRAERQRTLI
jgi:hypothetical protein